MSQPLPLKVSLRLQLVEKNDFKLFFDYVSQSGKFSVRSSSSKAHVFSGPTWEVSISERLGRSHGELLQLPEDSDESEVKWLLCVKSGTIANCGFVRHHFNSSCFIPSSLVEPFFKGVKEFSFHFHDFFMEHPDCKHSSVIGSINNELQLLSQQGGSTAYEEYSTNLWHCTKLEWNEVCVPDEYRMHGSFERSALDFPFSLSIRRTLEQPNETTYWITSSCDRWEDPEEIMGKLKKSLKDLGINTCLCIVEKVEDIKCKRDVKFRLLSKDSYNTVREHASELFVGRSDELALTRVVEHNDFYFDTQQKYLSKYRSSIRLREIKEGSGLPRYTINFQEDISVDLGQQNRDFQSFSVGDPSIAERIVKSKKLNLDDLGETGRKLKEKIFCYDMGTISLDLKASFRTTRIIVPWLTFPFSSSQLHGSQPMFDDSKTLTINIDHTQYEVRSAEMDLKKVSIYEVEVTDINGFHMEVSSLEVKRALVEVLQRIDVEFQASVINKRREHDCLLERTAFV